MGMGNWGRWALCVICYSQLAWGISLSTIATAAKTRGLPYRFFREIEAFESLDTVSIRKSNAARYYPFWNQIDLPASQFDKKPSKWDAPEWSLFYNELLHAWWDLVFTQQKLYSGARTRLVTLRDPYEDANPSDPEVAQEEAFSETTACIVLYLANRIPPEKLPYVIGKTVAPASHGDRPGYTDKSEQTYLSRDEYEMLFVWLTGQYPPATK